MKNSILILLLFVSSCQNKTAADSVIEAYHSRVKSFDKIEYNVTRIDSFSENDVWNRTGHVLIEMVKKDTLLGMSFYAKSDFYNKGYIYDNYKSFEISKDANNYEVLDSYGFLGSPGGQLISNDLYRIDSLYKTVNLIESDKTYQLHFSYENDTTFQVSNIEKTIILKKNTYLPLKIITSSYRFGNKTSKTLIFEDIRVNEAVINSVGYYKKELQNLDEISVEKDSTISFVNTKFLEGNLLDLWHDKPIKLSDNFPALISFWEVRCSPCIKSLPKLKLLQNTYKDKITVIGISTESSKMAQEMLLSKNIEFLNLKGTVSLLEKYTIISFPTYFLVDENGIIIKEYSYFSDEIEQDIKALLN